MKASLASCSASSASAVHLYGSTDTVLPISRTSRAKGSFLKSKSVVFWYCRISLRALVPGLYLLFFGAAAEVLGPSWPPLECARKH